MKVVLISTSTYPSDQGLRTVSSCLKRAGHNVKMIFLPAPEDYHMKYPSTAVDQIVEVCKDAGLIGISSFASTSVRANDIIEKLKPLNIPIVWGGPHATISPDRCIKHVDIVCLGEGEEAAVELANKLDKKEDITSIENLWVRHNGIIHKNDLRHMPSSLDHLAPPDYDLEDHYILKKGKLVPFEEKDLNGMIFFMTTRGCPNACTYCSNHRYRQLYSGKGRILRSYSIDYVITELVRLKNKFKSVGVFDIRDETLLVRPLEEIKYFSDRYKSEVGLRFKCLADPPSVSEEKLKLLVDAGLTDIIVGIQSGSDNLNLNVYKRYIKRAQALKAARIINKFKDKLTVMYDFITTNPYEKPEDVLESIKLCMEMPKPYFLSVNNLVFFLGTPLYNKAIEDGVISGEDDSAYDLNYWDRFKHIKLKKKNAYLNLVFNLMRGVVTERRYGLIPACLLKKLVSDKYVKYNLEHEGFTYAVGYLVQGFDFVRENVAKPLYRSLPTDFKVWYDKVRYKA
ncbi:radical SAM protein [Candidatus Woesearchaeota archaeon]|nr:MAG: radical SAM protein [Candidatus Woesearchaeota archaeon]